MHDRGQRDVTQQRLYAGVGVLLFLLSLAAPRLVMTQADGVLCQVITASEARERSKAHPEQRQEEDRVLVLANLAYEQACLAAQYSRFEESDGDADTQAVTDQHMVGGPDGLLSSFDWPVVAVRPPPKVRIAAGEERACFASLTLRLLHGQTDPKVCAPRAPPVCI